MSATLNVVSKPSTPGPRILEDLQAEVNRLKAENEALKQRPAQKVTLKISDKGCLSLYGIGRWPVTLYPSQWQVVLSHADQITAFIAENKTKLAWKE